MLILILDTQSLAIAFQYFCKIRMQPSNFLFGCGDSDHVNGVAFSPNGKLIASASFDGTVKLWRYDGKELESLKGHSDGVFGVTFSPDGKLIASASQDRTTILWNLERIFQLNFLQYGCDRVRDYLKTNAEVEPSDSLRDSFASHDLCDGLKTQKPAQ